MRISRLLIKPIKLLIFLSVVSALIYFRSVIFHPNVNQYMDDAVVYIENQFDIAVPSYLGDEKAIIAQTEMQCPQVAEVEVIENDDVSEPVTREESVNELDPVKMSPTSDEKSDLIKSLVIAIEAMNKKVDKLSETRKAVTFVNQIPEIKRDPEIPATVEDVEITADDASATTVTDDAVTDEVVKKDAVKEDTVKEDTVKEDTVKEDTVKEDDKKTLFLARQAFWNGDVIQSENLYQQLIVIDDSDPDLHGELGNIYYTQGKWRQAGQAYYQAAIRLLAQQKDASMSNQISYLLRVIQDLDRESAEKLRIKISEYRFN